MIKHNAGIFIHSSFYLIFVSFVFFIFTNTYGAYPDGLYAQIETNKGNMVAKLAFDKAPLTVINFVGLATGQKENSYTKTAYYDGLLFHRVVDNFVIQAGDPKGDGSGGPGYTFPDEISALKHDKPGILSMANRGPDTNGSQFFITHVKTPHLDGKHTVFGEVISGTQTIYRIEQGDMIEHIKILRIGNEAKNFVTNEKSFKAQLRILAKKKERVIKRYREEFLSFVKQHYPKAKGTSSGLYYEIIKPGKGKGVKNNDTVKVHYSAQLSDGRELIDSKKNNTPLTTKLGTGTMIKAWEEVLPTMRVGEKRLLIVPYNLAYGETGQTGLIPPKATMIFEIELLEIINL